MDKYRLDRLHPDTFEELVIRICRDLLGKGVIGFAKGKDGGRDGRFEGTAQHYPSTSVPWKGKFIIQAKHTTNSEASTYNRKRVISYILSGNPLNVHLNGFAMVSSKYSINFSNCSRKSSERGLK